MNSQANINIVLVYPRKMLGKTYYKQKYVENYITIDIQTQRLVQMWLIKKSLKSNYLTTIRKYFEGLLLFIQKVCIIMLRRHTNNCNNSF